MANTTLSEFPRVQNEQGSVYYVWIDDRGNILRRWYADDTEQLRIALWLVSCNAEVKRTEPNHVSWLMHHRDPADHDAEYDAWLDERWAEIQDGQALENDALDNW